MIATVASQHDGTTDGSATRLDAWEPPRQEQRGALRLHCLWVASGLHPRKLCFDARFLEPLLEFGEGWAVLVIGLRASTASAKRKAMENH